MLVVLGGKQNPDAADVKKVLDSVAIKADDAEVTRVVSALAGKDLDTLIKEGKEKLAAVPQGGGAGAAAPAAAAAAPAAGGKAAAPAAKKEEPKEEEEEVSSAVVAVSRRCVSLYPVVRTCVLIASLFPLSGRHGSQLVRLERFFCLIRVIVTL